MSSGLKEMQILKTTQSGFTGKLGDFERTLIGSIKYRYESSITHRFLQRQVHHFAGIYRSFVLYQSDLPIPV